MNTLVLGSGGREHAIFTKLQQSDTISNIFFAPGNAGVVTSSKLSFDILDFAQVLSVCKKNDIELIFVGPEAPLAEGIKDYFTENAPEIKVFGPDKNTARLESSKVFSQKFMQGVGIPTAQSIIITESSTQQETEKAIDDLGLPIVVKVDGLAAGKGVSIHKEKAEAVTTIKQITQDKSFGDAGKQVLLQSFMQGTEASLFALCNGKEAVFLPTARDYKRAYDHNEGPNTGGMGSFCPGDVLTDDHIDFIHEKIVGPVLNEFSYTGILYIGLMVYSSKADDLSVVEFNCRLGDPETQCVLPMIDTDLMPYVLWSCGDNKIEIAKVKKGNSYYLPKKPGASVNVVLAAKGYPGKYDKGHSLVIPKKMPDSVSIVHAGTSIKEGSLVSSGGRVLSVIAQENDLQSARETVYGFIETLESQNNNFENYFVRRDIGIS